MTPEKSAFLNHLMGCQGCAPSHGGYCALGWGAKLASDAIYVAGLASLPERRHAMELFKSAMPAERFAALQTKARDYFEVMHA